MKDTLVTLLTTSKGWIIRQALKYVGAAMMALTAWTQSKAEALDLPTEQVASTLTAGTSFAMGVTVLVIEMTLSFMARKNR